MRNAADQAGDHTTREAKLRFRIIEFRAFAADQQIGHHGQHNATAHAPALNRTNHGLEWPIADTRNGAPQLRRIRHIGAEGEGTRANGGDDGAAQIIPRFKFTHGGLHRLTHWFADGIALGGVIQRDDADRAFIGDGYMFHISLLSLLFFRLRLERRRDLHECVG